MTYMPEIGRFGDQEPLTRFEPIEPTVPEISAGAVEAVPVIDVAGARADVTAAFLDPTVPLVESKLPPAVAPFAPTVVSRPETKETTGQKAKIRRATEDDLDQLVDLDRRMFAKAYGEEVPEPATVRHMLARRMENLKDGGGWMHVCEVDGQVEGFVTVFKTPKPWDEFVSWEDSTNGGTLDGSVDRDSKFAYIANLTVGPKASAHRGRERLLANAFAEGFKEGVEYGYFESRMPGFKKWFESQDQTDKPLDVLAEEYANTTMKRNGKDVPIDYQLRMYDSIAQRGHILPNAFQDDESMNYGVVFRAKLPRLPKPVRHVVGWALQAVGRSPKIAAKLF